MATIVYAIVFAFITTTILDFILPPINAVCNVNIIFMFALSVLYYCTFRSWAVPNYYSWEPPQSKSAFFRENWGFKTFYYPLTLIGFRKYLLRDELYKYKNSYCLVGNKIYALEREPNKTPQMQEELEDLKQVVESMKLRIDSQQTYLSLLKNKQAAERKLETSRKHLIYYHNRKKFRDEYTKQVKDNEQALWEASEELENFVKQKKEIYRRIVLLNLKFD